MIAVPVSIAVAKPNRSTRYTSEGVMTMPLKLAPVKARLMARPRRRTNQRLTMVALTIVPIPIQPSDISPKAM